MTIEAYKNALEFFNSLGKTRAPFIPRLYDVGALNPLQAARKTGQLALILGAGISIPFKLGSWDSLLRAMLSEIFAVQSHRNVDHLIRDYRSSGPILARLAELECGPRANFRIKLKRRLYHNYNRNTSNAMMNALVRLIDGRQTRPPVRSILTYNLDCVLEDQLADKAPHVKFGPVFSQESFAQCAEKTRIYHPHGFIPRDEDDTDFLSTLMVFSEKEYHDVFADPFFWANVVQLELFSTYRCLFLGTSFSDPNLRRLLDLSKKLARGRRAGESYHFAVREIVRNTRNGATYAAFQNYVTEKDLESLGVHTLWVRSYRTAIPKILAAIRR